MLKKSFFILLGLVISNQGLFALQSLDYHQHRTFGIKLHSGGWGINYGYFMPKKNKGGHYIYAGYMNQKYINEKKDSRELQNARMVINKINNLYFFKIGYGQIHPIFDRDNRSSVGLSAMWNIGPMLAIYKPIYIIYSNTVDTNFKTEDIARYNPGIHSPRNIVDKSRFWEGAEQSKIKIGLHLKASLRFDWGAYESNFKGIETGFNVQYIPNGETIIYSFKPRNVYTNFFATITFGRITD